MKELGIYVHIPFCKQKCSYCDFVSFTGKEKMIPIYCRCLQEEIKVRKEEIKENRYEVSTIYLGGGTPSILQGKEVQKIIEQIRKNYPVKKEAEVTIEINPGTITKEKLTCYKKAKINRISIGLQSTNNSLLKQIGRIHTYEEFKEVYKMVKQAGFHNINIDFIIGLPNQTIQDIEETLAVIKSLTPSHVSIYSLILEENTPLAKKVEKGIDKLPKEEIERQMYWKIKEKLEEVGYIHYEISNFAKPDLESKHNLNCWKQEEYLGFGLAAHSYLNSKRYSNTEKIELYIENIEQREYQNNQIIHELQTIEEKQKEYMLLGLRRIKGVSFLEFKERFQISAKDIYQKNLDKLKKKELIEINNQEVKLTKKGMDLANLVWEEFI